MRASRLTALLVANTGLAAATSLLLALMAAPEVNAADVVFLPDRAPVGATIEASNLTAVCGETTPDLDFVQLYRSEGRYTLDDLIFEPGALVEHEQVVVSYSGSDGSFVVPDVGPGTYVVYLICYERNLPQLVDGARLTVVAGATAPATDVEHAGSPGSAEATRWPIAVGVGATLIGLLAADRLLRGRRA